MGSFHSPTLSLSLTSPSSSSGLTRGSIHSARPEFERWILGSSPRMTTEREKRKDDREGEEEG